MKYKLQCIECGSGVKYKNGIALCSRCNQNAEVILEKIHKPESSSFFDILYFLKKLDGIPVGNTPVFEVKKISLEAGKRIIFKDDTKNPSYSFKDRATLAVIAKAFEENKKTISTASTGNAGVSLAALTAMVGLKSIIFVPVNAPPPKLLQIYGYGAEVIKVKGNYDMAFERCLKYSKENGYYIRSTGINPFTREGKKTVSYEIYFDLKRVPEAVIVPVGDGNIISGVEKGFYEISKSLDNKMPKIFGVQSERSSAIYNAFKRGSFKIEKVKADSIADSINVDYPKDGYAALRAVYRSNGEIICVSESEILTAMKYLFNHGIFVEPSSAAGFAGAVKIKNVKEAVVILTGSGFKDIKAANKAINA